MLKVVRGVAVTRSHCPSQGLRSFVTPAHGPPPKKRTVHSLGPSSVPLKETNNKHNKHNKHTPTAPRKNPAEPYNAKLLVLGEQKKGKEALEVYHTMMAQGINPSMATMNLLLYALAWSSDGSHEKALEIYRDMEKLHGLTPHEKHLKSVGHALIKAGDIQTYLQLQPNPTTEVFRVLNMLCCTGGRPGLVIQICQEMKRLNVTPDARTLSSLIFSCVKAHQSSRGDPTVKALLSQIFNDWQSHGNAKTALEFLKAFNIFGADPTTLYNTHLTLNQTSAPVPEILKFLSLEFRNQNRPQLALKLWDEIVKYSISLDDQLLFGLVQASLDAKDGKMALTLLDAVKRNPLSKPNEAVCGQLAKALMASKNLPCVEDVLTLMDQQNHVPLTSLYAHILRECTAQQKEALGRKIHRHYVQHSVEDIFVATALITFYAKCGHLHEAYAVWTDIGARGLKKDFTAFNAMIAAVGHSGDGRIALHVFGEMLEAGLKPDASTLKHLLYALAWADDDECHHQALDIYHKMYRQYGIIPNEKHRQSITHIQQHILSKQAMTQTTKAKTPNMRDVRLRALDI